MKIIVLAKDKKALAFATKVLGGVPNPNKGGLITLTSDLGGNKSVGIYSVPNAKMYRKSKNKALLSTAYEYSPNLPEPKQVEGLSVKRMNRALRSKLQPKKLGICDFYLALNRDKISNAEAVLLRGIRGSVISMSKVEITREYKQRGGAVVYLHLPQSQVVSPATTKAPNASHVAYGTSAAHNLGELLSTVKVGAHLGLPVKFDSYGEAVTCRKVLEVMLSSLKVLNPKTPYTLASLAKKLGLSKDLDRQAYKVKINPARFLKLLGLTCARIENNTLDKFYLVGMRLVGLRMLQAVGEKVSVKMLTTTETLRPILNTPLSSLAYSLQRRLKHEVNLMQHPTREKITTGSKVALNKTIASLHQDGYHASGALIYFGFYQLASNSPFVAVVTDTSKGGVHLLAKEQMQEKNLFVCPAGSIEILPKGASGFSHMDPWVFLALMKKWKAQKTKKILNRIWDAIEAPLPSNRVGKRKKIYISLDGLKIEEI